MGLQRQVGRTLDARPSLNRRTAIAVLGRVDETADWVLLSVVPPMDRERAVQRAELSWPLVIAQRAEAVA